ncbi:polyketide synthetase [Thermothelomyces heterothallicus CBS 202.75]|uniref:polyketide synthetase n=1 Tax=Thermothelomyces heterothallicus CBS 202.75 TaxID=1149848 RepID=UPI0037427EA4
MVQTPRQKKFGNEPIAIIGSACRFPGAASTSSKLWELLRKPKDLLTKIPPDRFNADSFYHPDGAHHGASNVTESYFLEEDPRLFDAAFFNVKPVEAHSIDPQHRMLLEVVYESLEAAGQSIEGLAKSQTGVFVGLMCADFSDHILRDMDAIPTYMATGTARSLISNRISYFFDWHGPSMTIDTACSSSLFAVHQAVQLLRSGDSDLAVAAGSNLILGPELYIGESKLKMLSPTGRSRMWDADADGYARGEGVAAVILKRLSDAIRDGDHIESIIRESGINSDGRTKGLTMPNELAQADLIVRTYRKAGLDPTKEEERCQYFEAHGTGTEAGDCREAEGISRAFFGYQGGNEGGPAPPSQSEKLYVGSIKTVVGHTEGTAGLAGLLKASLAIQHSTIPPNMLFERLSPKVAPFYKGVEIATEAKPWPKASDVRRASVNSFGFGGANAHVILENYEPPAVAAAGAGAGAGAGDAASQTSFTPFVFSAASETALEGVLEAYAAHLRENPDLPLRDLSYTLHSRRSALGVRAALPAVASTQQLANSISDHLELARAGRNDKSAGQGASVGSRPIAATPRLLGVFTGQGAQWAAMGKELIQGSAFVRDRIKSLESALSDLPASARPSWSLTDELLADAASSRLGEALLAQPLCTAVQIVLVDLLREAGIEFAAVVGHSSGEIAAAYAARIISAEEAIKIAYYRGLCVEEHVKTEGAMMAVGTSYEDATELCNLDAFSGRLGIAACNSPSSVTLSGDAAAIREAKDILDDEKKFARPLKVNKAYHSHHMAACSAPYKQALEACNIEPRQSTGDGGGCVWYSSVYPGTAMGTTAAHLEDLKGEYWKDNMLRPVLFAQALETAIERNQDSPFNLVIEVGPHPALKGPASETLTALYGKNQLPLPPYAGTLSRGSGDIAALSVTLGTAWSRFGSPFVNFAQYEALLTGEPRSARKVVPNLPTYKWDHDKVFWHDTRLSRAMRNRKELPNPLLGRRIPDGVTDEMRWRNIIRPSELPWISGHQLQGQMVYPAAAYLSTAIEACAFLAEGGSVVESVEIRDFDLGKALVFDGNTEQTGVETLFSLSNIVKKGPKQITANFAFHAALGADADVLSRLGSGRVLVTLAGTGAGAGAGTGRLLLPPQRAPEPADTAEVREDEFYASLEKLGYEYTNDFRALSGMRRKLDRGSAYVRVPGHELAADAVLVHPALLDCALQAIFLAYWYPNDGSLDQLQVPTGIASLTVNTSLCRKDLAEGVRLPLESFLTEDPLSTATIGGDVEVYGRDGRTPLIQVQGVRITPLATTRTGQADRQLFMENVWGPGAPDGTLAADNRAGAADFELASDLERLTIYFMRKLVRDIPPSRRQGLEWHHEALFDFVEHVLEQTAKGRQRFCKPEWLDDTWERVSHIRAKHPDSIEVELTHAVGENLAAAVRGETQILQHMFKDNLLNRYYVEALGIRETTAFLARTVAQIVHRYPHMDILEIGAGTGGATKAIFREIGRTFSSYTYTDISTGFFEKAQEVFAATADKMIFRALDIEKDVLEQGYREGAYDLIIGSLVLHATKSLDKTMQATRRLLKPGGYLVLLELTNLDVLRTGFAMSGLPGWWLGRDDGRRYSPCATSARWHQVLLGAGFSGIDTITPEVDVLPRPFSVIVSQAVEPRVNLLREPLSHPAESNGSAADGGELVVVGGQSLATVILIDSVLDLTRHFGFAVTRLSSLDEFDAAAVSPTALVLNLAELDQPVFSNLTGETMRGLQSMLDYQRTILWVTQGCRAEQPYMSMSVGLGRTVALEAPGVKMQFLDLDISRKPNSKLVAEALIRLRFTREEGSTRGMLYSTEQELVEDDGRILVPRLLPIRPANDRYNSSKRKITKLTEVGGVGSPPLVLASTDAGYAVHEGASDDAKASDDTAIIRVTASTLLPVIGNLYGVLGQEEDSGAWVLGLSSTNGSRVAVPRGQVRAVGDDAMLKKEEADASSDVEQQQQKTLLLLALLAVEAQSSQILSAVPRDGTLLVNEPPAGLAGSLVRRAAERGTTVVFTASTTDAADLGLPHGHPVVSLSPLSSKRAVRAALPADVALFLDCSAEPEGVGLGSLVAPCVPPSCQSVKLAELGGKLRQQATLVDAPPSDTELASLPTLVDWRAGDKVPVSLQSVDSLIRFDGAKTYVLFGLTSDLGRSLVDWMTSHGARNVVMTSRRPNIDPKWLEERRAQGIRIQAFANDITDPAAVEDLVNGIRRSFPPIAGIMHGAMVLEDVPFSEMSLEIMNKVVRPKVLGTIHLDRLFQDEQLDFFVFFSSLASASGNRGQSNYSAANMYMTAKTFERRRKGLAASVLHLGAVMGIGYVMREASEIVFPAIRRAGFQWMDERAFRQCVAEAILAGRPDSGRSPEIVTGLRVINVDEEEPAPWMDNPRFQHCIVRGGTDSGAKKNQGGAAAGVKTRLLEAATPEEVLDIVRDSFLQKLQIMLQTELQTDDERANILAANAEDTGIDSLVAVEIRSWFQKEMDVDVPVLKILGGATMADLVAFAHEKLPAGLTPNLGNESAAAAAAAAAAAERSQSETEITPAPDAVDTSRTSTVFSTPPTLDPASSTGSDRPTSVTSSGHTTPAHELEAGVPPFTKDEAGVSPTPAQPPPGAPPSAPQEQDVERTAPMSLGQSRFWFLRSYIEDQTTFNISFSVRLKGPLQVDKLESAIQTLGHRHQALRTAFVARPGQLLPTQAVLKRSLLRLEKRQIKEAAEASEAFEAMKNYVFAIERGESMRLVLLSLSPSDHFLVVGYHHINMDGASLEVFMADLTKLYTGRPLAPRPFQYPDFAARQQLEVQQGKMDRDIAWWQDQLAGAALFRLLGTGDLCIGMADANRFEGDLASSVGMYLNLLPLRFRPSGDRIFRDTLKDVRRTAYAAMAHSHVPFDLVLNNLKIQRSTLHSPLFQSFINYRAGVAEKRSLGAVEGEGEQYHFGRSAYDISLDIMENPNSDPRLMFLVQEQLYSEHEAGILADTYMHLLDLFARRPDSTLASAPAFAPETAEEAIRLGRGNPVVSDWPQTIVHRVDDIIQRNPDTIAVREALGGRVWNYRQLRDRVGAIARALLAAGVTGGSRVALFQEPGFDWVSSLLAVMRVGAVFVPIDPGTPVERLAVIAAAARPAVALSHDATESAQEAALAVIRDAGARVVNVSRGEGEGEGDVAGAPANLAQPDEAAVVFFTSGTTGVPKGAIVPHRGITNFMEHTCDIRGPEVVLFHSALGFDLAMWQCFSGLAHGGTLVVAPRSMRGDPVAITGLMAKEKITCTGATPSEYHSWIQYGFSKLAQSTSWRVAMTGGEQCTPKLVDDFRSLRLPGLRLWNCYGPSEVTVGSNQAEIPLSEPPRGAVTVGKAMPNRSVYILDDRLEPVCAGAPGEVVIGGVGVGLGYLGNEHLTAEKFVPDPFAPAGGSAKMYRTGDRGRLTRDGELEILGRIDGDSQIKLRGIRIEMQDVEQAILRSADGALASVCVTARGEPPTLVAHAVFRPDGSVPPRERDAFLRRLASSLPLPQYMHPAVIVEIPSMPLNLHGKLDRRAVQELPTRVVAGEEEKEEEEEEKRPSGSSPAPLTQQELQLRSRIWERVIPEDVLSLYTVDRDTDFFHVGGNSMLLVEVQRRVKDEFGANLTIMRLFENSTLGAMAAAVHDAALESAGVDAAIDWEDETALTKDLADAVPSPQEQAAAARRRLDNDGPGGKMMVVILTGATGFIGRELLARLLSSPDVAEVRCIAVRDPSRLADVVESNPGRVSVHAGDLTSVEEAVGEDEQRLFADAHAVIHCGADVSFLKTYATLRRANVGSTKALARLALRHGLDFHYVSTAATGRLLLADPSSSPPARADVFGEESVAAYPPPPGWLDHYVASKWASEAFLERAAARLGLRVWVHRPTSVTGPGAGETDVMSTVMRFAKKLRAVPVSSRWRGSLDFVPVETVADGIVGAVIRAPEQQQQQQQQETPEEAGSVPVKFLHHSGGLVIPIERLQSHLEEEDGVEYRTVPLGEWIEMAVAEGLNVLVAAYLASVDEMDTDIVLQAYVKG